MYQFRQNVGRLSRIQRNFKDSPSRSQLLCLQHRSEQWQRRFSAGNHAAAKRVSKKQEKDLTQGRIKGEPLPPSEKQELRQESLQDVVRTNMRKFPHCVLLTKVGNFYELYYEHADEYAPKLGLRVASKGKDGISMAGFQYQYLNKYLKKLVQELDKHVAICSEFPEYVNGKLQTPIPRRVTRVITPGTLLDEDFLDQDTNNFLLSIHSNKTEGFVRINGETSLMEVAEKLGLAWTDISTGEFFVQTTDRTGLSSALMRIGASEVVLSSNIDPRAREEIALSLGLTVERLAQSTPGTATDAAAWTQRTDRPLGDAEIKQISAEEMLACSQLFAYVDKHLLEFRLTPQPPQRKELNDTMGIDRCSIKGLELLKTARDGLGRGSLFNTIQRTVTKGGSRLLRERLIYPSITSGEIEYRLDLVTAFIQAQDLHQTIVAYLKPLYDVARIAQNLSLNRGDAEEMLCLANTYLRMRDMIQALEPHGSADTAEARALRKVVARFDTQGSDHMCTQIKAAIDEQGVTDWLTGKQEASDDMDDIDDVSASTGPDQRVIGPIEMDSAQTRSRNGTNARYAGEFLLVMKRDASTELSKLHSELDVYDTNRQQLQDALRERLLAPRLLFKYDSRYGYICQTPRVKGLTETMLSDIGATLVGNLKTVRTFYVSEWTNLGRRIDRVKFEIRQEEQRIFEELRGLVTNNLVPLRQNAAVMNELDLAASFATLALEEDWVRPIISTQNIHNVVGGRHPTVKLGLQEKGQSFVSNDLHLDRKARAWLITGPNMAGKSTFLRQNALITILAQIGSYVPAEYAEIGIVDKIFSRIGAADDLFRNESTFMVEMLETACILRDATERSFVIMDEVGRGTAPEDGTAIAFASLHHLYHINKSRTLFATHFHDLADKTANWPQLAQYCTDLRDDEGSFTFIHKLRPGVNKKSHALRVAKMAGLPQSALDVARKVLNDTAQKPD